MFEEKFAAIAPACRAQQIPLEHRGSEWIPHGESDMYYVGLIISPMSVAPSEAVREFIRSDVANLQRRGHMHRYRFGSYDDPEKIQYRPKIGDSKVKFCNPIHLCKIGNAPVIVRAKNAGYTNGDEELTLLERERKSRTPACLITQMVSVVKAIDQFRAAHPDLETNRMVLKVVADAAREPGSVEARKAFARWYKSAYPWRWIWGVDAGPHARRYRDPRESRTTVYEPSAKAEEFFRQLGAFSRPPKDEFGWNAPLCTVNISHINEFDIGYY